MLKSSIINFVAFDEYEKIKRIEEEIEKIEGINFNYYKYVYEDCYFLEAYSSEAVSYTHLDVYKRQKTY